MKLIFAILFTVLVLVTAQKTSGKPSTTQGQTTKTGKRLQTKSQSSEKPKTSSSQTSTSAQPKSTTRNEKQTTVSGKLFSTSGKPKPSQVQSTTSGKLQSTQKNAKPTPRNQTTAKEYSTVKSDQKQTTKKSSGFEQWKKTNKKTYLSKTDEENAAKNYAKNEKAINEHNKRKNVTFKRGTNENSDMTYEQKKATKMGAKRNVNANRGKRSVPLKRYKRNAYDIPPPDVLDFR